MRRRKQRGQAIVEGALTLLTFAALLIGILDFGQVIYFHQTLTERARAAARYGAVNPTATSAIQNVAVFNAATSDGRYRRWHSGYFAGWIPAALLADQQ